VLYRHPQATVKVVHAESSRLACASFQVTLLKVLMPSLHEDEESLLKRCRNVPVATGRKHQQGLHRLSTSFEALVGHWYLESPQRLELLKSVLWQVAHLDGTAYEALYKSLNETKLPHEAPPPKPKRSFF
jgi:23S rRNA maturation mini-RNase III